jgi:2-oxo-3-hexenedioate decarboxylase
MNVSELAARLQKAVADRTAIDQLSAEHPDLDLATGYTIQRVLREAAGPLVGWKLGVTSRAKQAQVGVSSPVFGFLAGANALDLGEPLDTAQLIQPRCEPEIVFVLGRDLAGPHVTAADVLAASSGVAVGIEVLDSRYRDYRFTMADVVADNTSAGRRGVAGPSRRGRGVDGAHHGNRRVACGPERQQSGGGPARGRGRALRRAHRRRPRRGR